MRIKRTVASFFLLFAGIILLAHSVVPHHHHDHTSIVFLSCLLKSDSVTKKQLLHDRYCNSPDCEVPKDDCQENNKICTDVNILLKSGEDSKEELIAATNELIPLLLMFSVDDNTETNTNSRDYHFLCNTFAPLYYIDYLPDSQGLRAPPAC